jgi:hypothetical protein
MIAMLKLRRGCFKILKLQATSRPTRETPRMIFDHRTYTCKPGTIKAHLDLYAKMGLAVARQAGAVRNH